MKKILSLLCLGAVSVFWASATVFPELDPFSCTSIMVGKKASTDGAVITSHTCDGNYRTWVGIVPSITYQNDTTVDVFKNRLHTESVKGSYRMTLTSMRSSWPWERPPLPDAATSSILTECS